MFTSKCSTKIRLKAGLCSTPLEAYKTFRLLIALDKAPESEIYRRECKEKAGGEQNC